jgi:hypothetical protein
MTVPLLSHPNASPFWIIFVLLSERADYQMARPLREASAVSAPQMPQKTVEVRCARRVIEAEVRLENRPVSIGAPAPELRQLVDSGHHVSRSETQGTLTESLLATEQKRAGFNLGNCVHATLASLPTTIHES